MKVQVNFITTRKITQNMSLPSALKNLMRTKFTSLGYIIICPNEPNLVRLKFFKSDNKEILWIIVKLNFQKKSGQHEGSEANF